MDSTPNILLLDGNPQSAQEIQRFLKAGAHHLQVNHTPILKEGIASVRSKHPDLVLLDAQMTAAAGFDTLKNLIENHHIPVILLADSRSSELQRQAEQLHAGDYMIKNKLNLFYLEKRILDALKISEAEIKLDSTYVEFNNRQATLLKMLDKTGAGVVVVNREDKVLYASAQAYGILHDETLQRSIARYLTYRHLSQDEEIVFKQEDQFQLRISVSAVDWSGTAANLFVIEKQQAEEDKNRLNLEAVQPVLDSMNVNILVLQGEQIVFANNAARKHLNLTPTKTPNAMLGDFFEQEHKANKGISLTDLFREKQTQASLRQADGSMIPARLWSKPLTMGESLLEICIFTIRPEGSENQIPGERSDAETFSNDSILHLASHDLREPVRTILNYIQLVSDSLKKNNYDSAAEYSNQAKLAADRMEKLLTDFKAYIGLNERKVHPVKVSVKQIANDVLKQLKPLIDSTGAEVNIADMPEVTADKELMQILLYQLVDNALKFHKKGKKPVIDIGCDKFEGKVLFCVRDNGMGIAKKYHEKIFELFERLNRVDEFPGNGLGLALCQRIIEMQRGKIWVESLPGLGSSFYFTVNSQ